MVYFCFHGVSNKSFNFLEITLHQNNIECFIMLEIFNQTLECNHFRWLQSFISQWIAFNQRQASAYAYYSSTAKDTEISLPHHPSTWLGRAPQNLQHDWARYARGSSLVPKPSRKGETAVGEGEESLGKPLEKTRQKALPVPGSVLRDCWYVFSRHSSSWGWRVSLFR